MTNSLTGPALPCKVTLTPTLPVQIVRESNLYLESIS